MLLTQFYIAGNLVGLPSNAKNLEIQLNYGRDQFPNAGTVSLTALTWVKDEYKLLMAYKNAGVNSTGVGITEGPSLEITITNNGVTKTVFSGYVTFKGAKYKDRISITTKVVSHATVDWLNEVATGFSFEYLTQIPSTQPGYISPNDYVFVPYVLNSIPNYEQAAIATLSIFSVSQAIYKEIEEISDLIIEAAGVFTTIPAVLKFVVKIAYIIVLLAALIKLIEDTIRFLVSPVKYHAGMRVIDSLDAGAAYLNMKFVSDIWSPGSPYENEIIIPPKQYNAPVPDSIISGKGLLGFLTPDKNEQVGWYKGSYADLLSALKIKYNAKIVVKIPPGGATPTNQGTIYFIRKDKTTAPPQYVLPNQYIADYTFNDDEAVANYLISFQTDPQDMNTRQNYQGTIFQVITSQKTVNYQPFVTLTDLEQVQIPFGRASTKTTLTVPEQIIEDFLLIFDAIDSALVSVVNGMISAVNSIIGTINKIAKALRIVGIKVNWSIPTIPSLSKSNMAATIENRKGMLMLSYDHFDVPKILCINEGSQPKYTKINPNNDYLESGEAHWFGYHYVNSMVPKAINAKYSDRPYGNQSRIQLNPKVPFNWDSFLKVVDNNQIFAPDGVSPILMESLRFKVPMQGGSSGSAEIKSRFYEIWSMNFSETFLNPSGA